jgi:hypothetical protein
VEAVTLDLVNHWTDHLVAAVQQHLGDAINHG